MCIRDRPTAVRARRFACSNEFEGYPGGIIFLVLLNTQPKTFHLDDRSANIFKTLLLKEQIIKFVKVIVKEREYFLFT